MDSLWYIITGYFIIISIVAAAITVWDKQKAKRNQWRISEATLLLLSALGGSLAMYITMKKIRHKTKHPKFMIGIPVIMLCQVLIAAGLYILL